MLRVKIKSRKISLGVTAILPARDDGLNLALLWIWWEVLIVRSSIYFESRICRA